MLGLKLPFLNNSIEKELEAIFARSGMKLRLIKKREISKNHFQLDYALPVGATLGEFVEKLNVLNFPKGEVHLAKYFDVGEADVQLDVYTGVLPSDLTYKDFLRVKPPKDDGIYLPVGISRRGIEWLKLEQPNSNMLIAGMAGSGKSNFLRFALWYLNRIYSSNIEFFIINHHDEYSHLGIKANSAYSGYSGNIEDVIALLEGLNQVMYQRYELFRQYQVDTFTEYNSLVQNPLKHIVLCVDEIAYFEEEPKIQDLLNKLINVGGLVGISLILSTQRPSSNIITPTVKTIPNVLAFRTKNLIASKVIINNEKSAYIRDTGTAILDMSYPMHLQLRVKTPNMYGIYQDEINKGGKKA